MIDTYFFFNVNMIIPFFLVINIVIATPNRIFLIKSVDKKNFEYIMHTNNKERRYKYEMCCIIYCLSLNGTSVMYINVDTTACARVNQTLLNLCESMNELKIISLHKVQAIYVIVIFKNTHGKYVQIDSKMYGYFFYFCII